MGNLSSCVSKQVEKESLMQTLMQTLFDDMEKRLMACIKAELSRSRGSNDSSGNNTPPFRLIAAPKLIRQIGGYELN